MKAQRLETNVFFNPATQNNVSIFEEFLLRQATNETPHLKQKLIKKEE